MQETEVENIKNVYANRKNDKHLIKKYQGAYSDFIIKEREHVYESIMRGCFSNMEELKMLEIGAGTGGNLLFFHQLGIPYSNIFANELQEERINQLKINYPEIVVINGNAAEIETNQEFDVIFQSTVFTSVLSDEMRKSLAEKMWELLCDNGIVLWYDFIYDNPQNKNVKKVTKQEIKSLFPNAKKIQFHSVSLAPPIGRRVGKLYAFFNKFKFLRTHIIAVIHK